MATKRRGGVAGWLVLALTIGGLAVLASQILKAERLPDGPVDVVWDREACAHCRMHVGEPRFAAQLQKVDGQVLNYDDPGCLLKHLDRQQEADVHALWFHHVEQDRWLSGEEAGFRRVSPTPMGFDLGAVERDEPGALSLEQARAALRSGGAKAEVH